MSDQLISKPRVQVVLGFPFFGSLLLGLRDREYHPALRQLRPDLAGTAATDGVNFYFNREWFTGLSLKHRIEVMCHEALHCFPEGTAVAGSDCFIQDVKDGGCVVGADGSAGVVQKRSVRDYSGDVVGLKARGLLPIRMTPEHPVLTTTSAWKTVERRNTRKNVRSWTRPEWKKAGDVRIGDWVFVPRIQGTDYPNTLRFDYGNEWSVKPQIRSGLVLDEEIAEFFGWYVADGYTSEANWEVHFALSEDERDIAAWLKSLVEEKLGYRVRTNPTRDGRGIDVEFCSAPVGRALRLWCGVGAHNKKIPDFILYNKDERLLRAFLRGYVNGDGFVTKSVSFGSASRLLAMQVQLAFARLGALVNLYERSGQSTMIRGKVVSSGPLWIGLSQSLRVFEALGYPKNVVRPTRYAADLAGCLAVRVDDVWTEPFSGKVYNFETTDHTYTAGNIIVHNCALGHIQADRRGNRDPRKWNLACVPPGYWLLGDNVRIEDASVGSEVVGFSGVPKVVSKTFCRSYEGDLVKLKANLLLPFEVTPEHPVLVARFKVTGRGNTSEKRFEEPRFVAAGELRSRARSSGWALVIPKLKPTRSDIGVSLKPFLNRAEVNNHDQAHNTKVLTWPVDEESAWVAGMYVAEGSAGGDDSIKFTLSAREAGLASRLTEFFRARFGYKVRLDNRELDGSLSVCVGSSILRRAFAEWFGSGAKNKKVSDWLMFHENAAFVRSFLRGWSDGAGSYFAPRKSWSASTVSGLLAQQIQLMFTRFGCLPGVIRCTHGARAIRGKALPPEELFVLSSVNEDVCGVLGLVGGSKRRFVTDAGDCLLVPLSTVVRRSYRGFVYNVATEGHTYLLSNAVVHNCDYVVNQVEQDAGLELTPGSPIDDKFKGMTEEQVYELLPDDPPSEGKGQGGVGVDIIFVGDPNAKPDLNNPNPQGGNGPVQSLTPAQARQLAQEWKDRLIGAYMQAKSRGAVPAGLDNAVDEITNPRVPMRRVLQKYMSEIDRDDYDWRVGDRRFISRGVFLPDLRNVTMRPVVAVDTSGSMCDGFSLQEAVSMAFDIFRMRGLREFRYMECDADVHTDRMVKPQDLPNVNLTGGGGTSFEPVFERIAETRRGGMKPTVLVFFTDLMGSFPDHKPDYPVIWVTRSENFSPPWGQMTIRYDDRGFVVDHKIDPDVVANG